MSSNKQAAELERTLSTEAAAELLEQIAKGLRGRELVVQGETPLSLMLPGLVEVKLEAKSKSKKASLSLKLSWQPPLVAGPGVRISTGTAVALDSGEPTAHVAGPLVIETPRSRELGDDDDHEAD